MIYGDEKTMVKSEFLAPILKNLNIEDPNKLKSRLQILLLSIMAELPFQYIFPRFKIRTVCNTKLNSPKSHMNSLN
jgi:hypothetical protein